MIINVNKSYANLCHQAMGLSSYFQHAWDGRLKTISNLRLILSGSHVSTMIRGGAGLFGPALFRALCREWVWAAVITDPLDLMPLIESLLLAARERRRWEEAPSPSRLNFNV